MKKYSLFLILVLQFCKAAGDCENKKSKRSEMVTKKSSELSKKKESYKQLEEKCKELEEQNKDMAEFFKKYIKKCLDEEDKKSQNKKKSSKKKCALSKPKQQNLHLPNNKRNFES